MRPPIKTREQLLTFGKYRGQSVARIINNNPGYILWLKEEDVCEVADDIYEEALSEEAVQSPPESYFYQSD